MLVQLPFKKSYRLSSEHNQETHGFGSSSCYPTMPTQPVGPNSWGHRCELFGLQGICRWLRLHGFPQLCVQPLWLLLEVFMEFDVLLGSWVHRLVGHLKLHTCRIMYTNKESRHVSIYFFLSLSVFIYSMYRAYVYVCQTCLSSTLSF